MPIIVPGKRRPEKVTKIDAARRQLATAITLWFTGGDTVSIYTLSHAAYEVIHNFTRRKRGRDLLFDSLVIRDEYRKEFNTILRNPANFFKHAQRGKTENPTVEFYPETSELFFLYSVFGLSLVGIELNNEETVFCWWITFHRPEILTEKGRKFLSDHFPVDSVHEIRRIKKSEFFNAFMDARRKIAR